MKNDIKRRVELLEKIIGIDLDTPPTCNGSPDKCPDPPCKDDVCPLRNNLVSKLDYFSRAQDYELALHRAMFDLLVRHGRLPAGLAEAAKLQVRKEAALRKIESFEKVLMEVGETSILYDMFDNTVIKTRQDLLDIEKALRKKEDEFNASTH